MAREPSKKKIKAPRSKVSVAKAKVGRRRSSGIVVGPFGTQRPPRKVTGKLPSVFTPPRSKPKLADPTINLKIKKKKS